MEKLCTLNNPASALSHSFNVALQDVIEESTFTHWIVTSPMAWTAAQMTLQKKDKILIGSTT